MICFLKKEAPLFLLPLLCLVYNSFGQQNVKYYRNQITAISENDNYTFKYKDRYYSNGMAIRFSSTIGQTTPAKRKKILTVEAGQMIFIPYLQNTSFRATLDRPFTGFLYARGGLTYFTDKNNVLRWNTLAGVVGEAAGGKEVQRWHHKNFNLPYPYGWETQLKSEFGLNVQATYYKHLLAGPDRNLFNLHTKQEILAGTFFTQASSGLLLKFGIFEKPRNSAYWEAGLHTQPANLKRNHELFLYFEPMVTYQVYNATVQGGMFTHDKDEYTTDIQPYYYSHKYGIMYAQYGFFFHLGFAYKTKEARTMKTNESFGTIGLGFKF
jgi:lipid A 3-O-deacylase